MKEFIVLVSTIVLGLAIAVMVFGFKDSAKKIADKTVTSIESVVDVASNAAISVQ